PDHRATGGVSLAGGGRIAGGVAIAFLIAAGAGDDATARARPATLPLHETKAHARPQFDRHTLLVELKSHGSDYGAVGVRLVREIPHTEWALVAVHEGA